MKGVGTPAQPSPSVRETQKDRCEPNSVSDPTVFTTEPPGFEWTSTFWPVRTQTNGLPFSGRSSLWPGREVSARSPSCSVIPASLSDLGFRAVSS